MRTARAVGLLLALALTLTACSAPAAEPVRPEPHADPARPPDNPPPAVDSPPDRLPSPPHPGLTLAPAPANLTVAHRKGDAWQVIYPLDNHVPPGPAEIKLLFAKPVRRAEVELALTASQSKPVRGAMQWADDRTLIWSVARLPARLDFLLGGAHDTDGVPLPGGIPSLYTGEPPRLVAVDTATGAEQLLMPLPADVVRAELSTVRKAVNLMVWVPGTSRWDWQVVDFYADLEARSMQPGRVDGAQPRFAGDLENWVVNQRDGFVAGLRTAREPAGTDTFRAALVLVDPRGGRQQVYRDFIDRYVSPQTGDYTTHLAWSGEGQRVAALSYRGSAGKGSDLVAVDILSGERTVLMEALPVPSHATRLAWSPDSRYVLAGNLLVDLKARSYNLLSGSSLARGLWAGAGARLLYGEDWGLIYLVDPAVPSPQPLGTGLIAGWGEGGKAYLVRWPSSGARYLPPGSARM